MAGAGQRTGTARKVLGPELMRFVERPPSVRAAARMIVATTSLVVVIGAVLMRVFDPHDFPSMKLAVWWALQTATTVGYGDVVPKTTFGYIVGAFVMLEGIAFLAIVTASITSTFVTRAQRELGSADELHWEDVARRLARIEEALGLEPEEPVSPTSHDAALTAARLHSRRPRPLGG
jgi:voltage-gated potassium channel